MQNKTQVLSPELSVQETHYEPLMKAPYHCDRKSRISIILSGGVREIVGNREEAGTPMSIVIKPADARHRNEFSPQGARIVSVCWDANRTPDILSVAGFTEWRWLHGTSPASAGIRFLMQLKTAENQSQLEESIIELMADLTNAGMANHQTPPLWLERIAERTWQLTDPFTAYSGTYVNEDYGTVEISGYANRLEVRNGNLQCVATPYTKKNTIRVELIPGRGEVVAFQYKNGEVVGLENGGVYFEKTK